MAIDYTKLSDSDLRAIAANNVSALSDEALRMIAGQSVVVFKPVSAPSTERSWGDVAKDIPAGVLSGVGSLLQVPGQLTKLVPGMRSVGEALEVPGEAVQKFGEDLKSAGLKAREALRSQAISEAAKDGILSEFATTITSTLKDPALITSFITEQVPLLIGPLGAARLTAKLGMGGVEAAGAAAAKGLTGEAAEAAAKDAAAAAAQKLGQRATTAAIGTGTAMQAADVSGDTYTNTLNRALEMGMPRPEAEDAAINAARIAAAGGAAVSLGANIGLSKLGGAAIERRLAGLPGKGRIQSGVGEATSETLEEAGGQVFQNIGIRTVDPNQSLTAGVGSAAAMGALGGGFFGSMLGKKPDADLAPGQRPGESLYDTAARLNREIKNIEDLAKLGETDQGRTDSGLLTNMQLVDMYREQGYGAVRQYQQQLVDRANDPTTPPEQKVAAQQAVKEIQDLFKQVNQEEFSRQMPSQQSYRITASDLTQFDIKGSDPVYKAAFGKDISDPVQVQEIQDAIDAELNRKGIRQKQAARLMFFKEALDLVVETLPAGGLRAATTVEPSGGDGAGVAGVSVAEPATGGVGAVEPSGVVSTEPVATESDGRKAEPTTPVMEDDITPQKAEVPAEVKSAQDLLSAIDAGGVSLNTAKLNKIARDLGLEVSKQAKPEETITRIREAVTRAESAPVTEAPAAQAKAPTLTVTPSVSYLPKDLAGAKPRYSYGEKAFQLQFNSDIDKALYITAQKTPSRRDADYRAWLGKQGFTPDQITQEGQRVREAIKGVAAKADPAAGPINLPEQVKKPTVKKSLAPEVKDKLEPIYKRLEQRVKTAKPEAKPEAKAEEAPKEKTQKEALMERRAELIKELDGILKKILAKYNLTGVTLNLEEGMEEEGSYSGQIIKLALNLKNPVRVLRHESIHALKDMGFFSDAQWKTLVKRAQDEWVDKYLKNREHNEDTGQSRYEAYVELLTKEGLNPTEVQEAIIEEAIADAFGDFDVNGAPPGLMAAIHRRMKSLFKAIKEAFGQAGIDTAEEIFGKIEKGSLKPAIPMGKEQAPKMSLRGVPLSTRPIMEASPIFAMNELGLKTEGEKKPGGIFLFNDVRSIANALNSDTINNYGVIDREDRSANVRNVVAKAIADEVAYQVGTTSETGTGLGWYSNNYPRAVKRLAKKYPELGNNPHARSVFSALVAITSNGEKVSLNIKNAIGLYEKLRVGEPMVAPGSRRATALDNNLQIVQDLLAEHGTNFKNVLLQEILVKDMNAAFRARGKKPSGDYLATTKIPAAAIYFGPKLGAFYANLEGAEGYLTMDMWWTRSINRMRGLLMPQATESSIKRFRDIAGNPDMTRDEVISSTIPLRNRYEELDWTTELEYLAGEKEPNTNEGKPRWTARAKRIAGPAYDQLKLEHDVMKMANTIYTNEYEMLEEAPFGPNDREFMYRAARDAQRLLKQDGLDLSLADIQAALWYYEKRLYQHLSGRKADDIGYDEAISAVARESDRPARPSVVFDLGVDRGAVPGASIKDTEGVRKQPSEGQAKLSLRGVVAEVAPNPDIPVAASWRQMTQAERLDATKSVAKKVIEPILSDMGLKGYSFKFSSGKYEGEVNPNILIEAPESATVGELEEVARVVGYILDQKAMVAYDEYNTDSGDQAGFVKVMIPASMDDQTVTLLRNHISKEVPQADGDTLRDGALVYGNFSAYNDNVDTLSDEEYHDAIVRAIEGFGYSETIKVSDPLKFHSQLVWPDNRESYLKGTRYGESGKIRGGEGADVRRQGRSRLEAISEQAIALRDRWIDARGAARIGGRAGDSAAISTEPTAEYGRAIDGSETAVGVHFSQQPRAIIDSQFYGAGLRGMERERLEGQPDIRNRIYFYVDTGKGVFPEAGVGGSPHVIRLNNLYNVLKDELGLVKSAKGDTAAERSNVWERAIKKAGFDGYFFPDPLQRQGYAVLIGKHRVETKLSLRSQAPEFKFWFGQSKIVDKDGKPKVMYHGTARDITEFKAKQAGAIFLTDDPQVSEGFGGASEIEMVKEMFNQASSEQRYTWISEGAKTALDDGYITKKDYEEIQRDYAAADSTFGLLPGAVSDVITEMLLEQIPSRSNIIPLYVKAEAPFDYENKDHVNQVVNLMKENTGTWAKNFSKYDAGDIGIGNWERIERDYVQRAIKELGFDSFYVKEAGRKNLAVYSPTQIVSATGNVGAYRQRPITAEEAARFDMTEEQAAEAQERGDIRFSLRSAPTTPEFKRWFDDSKVVDEDGEPALMYHYTTADITEFKPSDIGTHVGTIDQAESRTKARGTEGGNIMPLYVSIKNPLRLNDSPTWADPVYYIERSGIDEYLPDELVEEARALKDVYKANRKAEGVKHDGSANRENKKAAMAFNEKVKKELERQGYDGIVYSNTHDGTTLANKMRGDDSYIAFNPEQIKSATGNIGTYSPETGDIRRSLRSTLPASAINAMDRIAPPRYNPGWAERIMNAVTGDTFTSIRQKFINRYERLAEYDRRVAKQIRQMGGVQQLADSKAETAALFSDLGAGVLEAVMGVHDRVGGAPIFRNGVTTVSNYGGTVKGLLEIFRPISDSKDPDMFRMYQTWAAVQRGKRLTVEGREDLIKPAEIRAINDLRRSNPDMIRTFEAVQKDWQAYNNALVKYQVDTGVISPEMAKEWTKHGDYFPFYRLMDGDDIAGPKTFSSIGNVRPPKKLKGGEDPLGDFFENIVRNSQAAIQTGMKNVAAQRATEQAMRLNEVTRLTTKQSGVAVYRVYENGKEVYYKSHDPLFIEAIKALNMADIPFMGLLAKPASMLRNLVTKDPAFMLANMMRDSLSAWATTGIKMTPVLDTLNNFSKAIAGKSPELDMLYSAGILGGYDYALGSKEAAREFETQLRRRSGKLTPFEIGTKPARSLWEALEKGTQASDAATRMEVYKKTLAATGSEAEALAAALEVMNFNRKGNNPMIRVLTAAVPFLNARIQGLDVLFRTAIMPLGGSANEQAQQRMKTFWVRGMTMLFLSSAYWLLTHDDEDYKKQEQETRDNNWLIPSLGIKIPIPFEVGVMFKVIPERIMALTFGTDTSKDFTDSMKRQFVSTFAFNPIPQLVLPAYEVKTNHSFFTDRPIIGKGLENVADKYQVGPSTSRVAQMIGDSVGFSPMKVDHLLKGYFGTIGTYASDLFDMVYDMGADSPKASKRFEQMPVIKRFAVDPEARGTVTAYYKLKDEVDQAVRTANLLERSNNFEEGTKYTLENLRLLATDDYVKDIEKSMKDYREMKQQIMAAPYSADTKRDLLKSIGKMESLTTANIQNIKKFAQ